MKRTIIGHAVQVTCLMLGMGAATSALAELPRYSVLNLEDWWGPDDPSGSRVYGVALNNKGELLVNNFQFGNYGAGLQTWKDGARVDGGVPPYPSGYDYSSGHLRAFTDSATWAVDSYSITSDDHQIVILDMRNANTSIIPDIPGAIMDGSAPALSAGANFMVARSNDNSKGWHLDVATGVWRELVGPGTYLQPDSVNNKGMAAGKMGDAGGRTVPFYSTPGGIIRAVTDEGNPIFGEAVAINNNGLATGTANGRAFLFNGATMEFRYLSETVIGVRGVDINDAGTILGVSGFGNSSFTTLWSEEYGLVSVSSLILGNEDPFHPEWLVKGSTDINDEGWILGIAEYVPNGSYHQVLLRPVPEPGAAVLLGLSGLGLLKRRRRKASRA